MYSLHPPLTAFPPVLFFLVVVYEALGLFRPNWDTRRFVRFHLVLAVLFTTMAFFSGYQASDLANQTFTVGDEFISRHHSIGRLLFFLSFPCLALQVVSERATHGASIFRALYFAFLATCFALVVYTGYLGGELVFGHGAGVRAVVTP